MRWKVLIVVGVLAASLASVAFVACSGPGCNPGTLRLHIALLDQTPLADHITIVGTDPGAAVSETFPHTPNQAAADASIEHITLDVSWPQGYPAYAVVHLTTSAFSGTTLLGNDTSTFRLVPGCSESSLLVSARGFSFDDGGAGAGD